MSFKFEWPSEFPAHFYENAKRALSQALNAGAKPGLLSDKIIVQDMHLGSIPPELDLLTIEELSVDGSFKGRFMLSYNGDAFISLATHVHVNPLTQYKHALELLSTPSALLQTAQMFVELTLSQLRLRCVIVLAFSKMTGLTLAFKDDPLESLNVSSSFDSISVIHQFIQAEIENQLRERFRRDLPSLIHRLSQRWLADMGQHPPSHPVPAVVVEREPDDSFHDSFLAGDIDADEYSFQARSPASSHSPSPSPTSFSPSATYHSNASADISRATDSRRRQSSSSPSTLMRTGAGGRRQADNSEGEDESDTSSTRADDRSSSGLESSNEETGMASELKARSPGKQKNVITPSRAIPAKSSVKPKLHLTPPSSNQALPPHMSGTDSPILRSLQRTNSTFATTFSRPSPHLDELPPGLEEVIMGQARKANRTRLHRIDTPSPGTSPQKPSSIPSRSHHNKRHSSRRREKHNGGGRGEPVHIRREELDEYFPIQTSSGFAPQMRPRADFPSTIPSSSNRIRSGVNSGSLRRTMMSNRLKESNYFTSNYAQAG